MTSKRKWKKAGLFYFVFVFFLIPVSASAYIDPSVTSYAVQALAGVIVATGAFFAAYGRKTRKLIMRCLGIDDISSKPQEPKAEIRMEELREETEARKAAFEAASNTNQSNKKGERIRCLILSLICGVAAALVLILRPCISFYLDNEGEFWFSLESVIGKILLFFCILAAVIALLHAILPDRKIKSPRMLFAALVAAVLLCSYIQSHFMSAYLPVLTGDPIDWNAYSNWGLASIGLWGGILILAIIGYIWRPKVLKIAAYGVLALLLCVETFTVGYELITAKHENRKISAYCSSEGLYQTSEAGNIVILVSDTFEGSYMNAVLERYPEYREMLPDITYYDNVTGTSVFTYFSYARFLTGVDFPLGATSEEGVSYCFENETTVDTVKSNGWDIGYYITFSPTPNLEGKLINYANNQLVPDSETAATLAGMMIRSVLFRSVPQVLKPKFIVYTLDYEQQKEKLESNAAIASPYVESDRKFYRHITKKGVESYQGKPKLSVIQLRGIHEPSNLNADFEKVKYSEDVPTEERKIQGARAQLKLLRNYLDSLKAAGTYDNTTVIMMADHGFNMRYYPAFLVKEAHREEDEFRTDHTPLAVHDDFEALITGLTSGKSFRETVEGLSVGVERTRYVIGYRGNEYESKTFLKSTLAVNGEAKDPLSYRIEKDEFAIDEQFPGRYRVGTPFISNGSLNDNVAVYGLAGSSSYAHTVLFDIHPEESIDKDLTLKIQMNNQTDEDQSVIFVMEEKELAKTTLSGHESREMEIPIPCWNQDRILIEIRLPDAVACQQQQEMLGWYNYASISISNAALYEP